MNKYCNVEKVNFTFLNPLASLEESSSSCESPTSIWVPADEQSNEHLCLDMDVKENEASSVYKLVYKYVHTTISFSF